MYPYLLSPKDSFDLQRGQKELLNLAIDCECLEFAYALEEIKNRNKYGQTSNQPLSFTLVNN